MAKEHETNLGRFIRSNRRQDGTDHVFMSVPDHLCPSGWPKTITLPSEGKVRGSLEDPVFLAKVRREAEVLNARLDQRRLEEEVYRSDQRNARALANIYFKTQRFRDVSEARQYRNRRDAMLFVDWAERRGDPDFATLRKPDFEDFLALYDNRPSQKLELRSTLNILCTEAMEAGWRSDNPISRIPWTVPKPAREVVLWTDETAHRFAKMAQQMGQPGLAALIVFGLQTGQRLGDLRAARHDVNYRTGMFQLKQSKTGALVKFPVNKSLCRMIEAVQVEGSPYLFNDADTGAGFTSTRLTTRFNEVRHAVTSDGDPLMLLATLRHSAVCRMERAGVSLIQIASVTGHKLARVHSIIARYAVDREGFAAAAMMKLNQVGGGDAGDFVDDDPFAGVDAKAELKSVYRSPPPNPARPGHMLAAKLGQHRHRLVLPPLSDIWGEADEADEADNIQL
ncbi:MULTISPECIES: tyrosine-type recombinase/integrase [Alphaproteobacteria]|uniref:tyrosine-type recombinase/integrase n=1 Tax=Alphaproteobacteria TaxID=28211 RepID=UPI000E9EE2E8|nr:MULTISPECIES: tyrosine-type recombinase/integrase [Alphaproteobacteria]HBY44263.1 hypothetical protein [Brevundimonas sp.]